VNKGDDLGLPPGMSEVYLQGARDQLGGIAELAERLVAAGDDIDAVDQLRREAHKIRGSAGSFGFAQATAVAAELEEAAKQWLAQPEQGANSRGAVARAFVRRLAAALFTKQAAAVPVPTEPPPNLDQPPPTLTTSVAPAATDVPELIVVEDDAAVAERLAFGIEVRGYRFVVQRTGPAALDYLRKLNTGGTVPLVLIDVDRPDLDGYSILQALQAECPGKFRVVLMTEHGDKRKQRRGRETCALDYLVTGTSLWTALEDIRRWVGR
jgi:CheY-like chemotaxis protein/HPt (histidine-containing phosphotransfer) domain-containing protein